MRTCSHLCVCDEASESTHVDCVLQTLSALTKCFLSLNECSGVFGSGQRQITSAGSKEFKTDPGEDRKSFLAENITGRRSQDH